jgi:hypothetical protein
MSRSGRVVRSLTIVLGPYHRKEIQRLARAEGCADEEILARAVDFYLGESAATPGWEFPKFLGAEPEIDDADAIAVEVSPDGWERLSDEGSRQQVEPELLARHALSFALAERQRRGNSAF